MMGTTTSLLCRILIALAFLNIIQFVFCVDTHYFIAVNSSQYEHKNATITCPESMNCDIWCSPSYSCSTLNVDATNALALSITCDGTFSCSSMNVTTSNHTTNIAISCSGESSCYQSTFHTTHADIISIHCVNQSACAYAAFFTQNAQHASVHIDGSNSAQDATIYSDGLDGVLNVFCSGYTACNRLNIEAGTMTGDLNVFCHDSMRTNYEYMCHSINVHAANMFGNVYFECNTTFGQFGCKDAQIFCPHNMESNCSILCSGSDGFECQFANIYVMNPLHVNSRHFDIICEGETACFGADILCFYDPKYLSAAASAETSLIYNYYDHIWSCDDHECGCPFSHNKGLCDGYIAVDCDIDCFNISDGGCEGSVIDASLSANLYVDCEPNSVYYHDGCEGTTIICPQNMNHTECMVSCSDTSCASVTIIAPNGTNALLHVQCKDTRSCENMQVEGLHATDLNFNLECDAKSSCRNMRVSVSNANLVNINCRDTWSCYELEMNISSGPNRIDFSCGTAANHSSGACMFSIVKAYKVPKDSVWNHHCLNHASCHLMNLDILSATNSNLQLSLFCVGGVSCYSMNLAAPNGRNASIHCEDTRSCSFGGGTQPYRLGWDLSNFTSVYLLCNSSNATYTHERACGAHMMLTNVDIVDIRCINNYDCAATIFAMQHAGGVSIDCAGFRSCYNSVFRGVFSDSLSVDCAENEACRSADIECPFDKRDVCQISCSDYYSCMELEIFVEDEYEYEYLNLYCDANQSCTDLYFRCNAYGRRQDTQYIYNDTSSQWECIQGACCPSKSALIDLCTNNTDCIIYCDRDSIECYDKMLNGRNATSLTVYCGDCSSAAIYCPLSKYGECRIYCSEGGKCSGLLIYYGNDDNNISLQCNASSCDNVAIYGSYAGNIHFESILSNSSDVTIYGSYAKSIDVTCITSNLYPASGCKDIYVFGENMDGFVNVTCYGPYACNSANFDFEFASNIRVVAAGDRALYHSFVQASNASSLDVVCSYNERSSPWSCYYAYIFYPQNNATLYCFGRACYKLYVYAVNDMKDVSFNLKPCDTCYSIDECISDTWFLRCGDSYQTQAELYKGSSCSDDNVCECRSVVFAFNASFHADHNDSYEYCYVATAPLTTATEQSISTLVTTAITAPTDVIASYVETMMKTVDDSTNSTDLPHIMYILFTFLILHVSILFV